MTKLIDPTPWGSIEEGLPFGSTKHPYSKTSPHKGKDHKWRYSDPVRSRKVVAPVSGKIKTAHNDGLWHSGWGNYIDIQWGDDPNDFVRLAHLRTGTVRVKVGDRVKAGDLLGTMGNTGNTGGDDHLHEELWINGKRVDPDLYRGPKGRQLPGTESTSGGEDKPLPPAPQPDPEPEKEDDDMAKNSAVYYDHDDKRNTRTYLVFNTQSGFFHQYTRGEGRGPMADSYNKSVAIAFDTTSWAHVTHQHAAVIIAGLQAVLPKGAPAEIAVTLVDDEGA